MPRTARPRAGYTTHYCVGCRRTHGFGTCDHARNATWRQSTDREMRPEPSVADAELRGAPTHGSPSRAATQPPLPV